MGQTVAQDSKAYPYVVVLKATDSVVGGGPYQKHISATKPDGNAGHAVERVCNVIVLLFNCIRLVCRGILTKEEQCLSSAARAGRPITVAVVVGTRLSAGPPIFADTI